MCLIYLDLFIVYFPIYSFKFHPILIPILYHFYYLIFLMIIIIQNFVKFLKSHENSIVHFQNFISFIFN